MIILTRLGNGAPVAVNPDLIERAESTPDTVITLVDGHKLVVEEPLEDVVSLVREWRASVAARAITLSCASEPGTPGAELDAQLSENLTTANVADATAHHSTANARVLRLPTREV